MSQNVDTKNQFGLAISVLNRSAGAYFSRKLKPYGIGPGQQAYLLALEPEEQIPQDVLSRRLQVDKANVTRALAALERLGLIHRTDSPADKRIRLIRLSAKGIKTREEVKKIAGAWIEKLQNSVSEQNWETLVDLLVTVAESSGRTE